MVYIARKLATTALVSAALAFGGMIPTVAQAASNNSGDVKRPASASVAELAPREAVTRIMAAAVTATGTFATSRQRDSDGVKSVAKQAVGTYEVVFRYSRLHKDCFYTANIADRDAGTLPAGYVNINALAGTNNGLWIETFDATGADADLPFIVVAVCNG